MQGTNLKGFRPGDHKQNLHINFTNKNQLYDKRQERCLKKLRRKTFKLKAFAYEKKQQPVRVWPGTADSLSSQLH